MDPKIACHLIHFHLILTVATNIKCFNLRRVKTLKEAVACKGIANKDNVNPEMSFPVNLGMMMMQPAMVALLRPFQHQMSETSF